MFNVVKMKNILLIINVVQHVILQDFHILMQIVKHVQMDVTDLHTIGHHGVKNA